MGDVSDVILEVQREVFPQRIRILDVFRDFDRQKRDEITPSQFLRCMQMLFSRRVRVNPKDAQRVIEHYAVPNGNVNYKKFCEAVEEVFVTKHLHLDPTATVPEGGAQVHRKAEVLKTEDPALNAILCRCSLLMKSRGIVMRYCYEDADRSDSTSLIVPRRGGKVTEDQFRRFFPFQTEFSMAEIEKIIVAYKEVDGNINYRRFSEDITSSDEVPKDAPIPTSEFIAPPDDGAVWSNSEYAPLERMTAAIIERRLRLYDYFQDFDHLRTGWCRAAQFDTVVGIMNLGPRVTQHDVAALKEQYGKQDLHLAMFNYAKFCEDVNRAFTHKNIHTEPLARIELTKPDATRPSRVARVLLTNDEKNKIAAIEENCRARVAKRRILFVNAFADFDPVHTGHVTVSQFYRVMETLNMNTSEEDMRLLTKRYCDQGNKIQFNYREFCRVCDPPDADMIFAEIQQMAPYEKHVPSKYFDNKTKVYQEKDNLELTATIKADKLRLLREETERRLEIK